MLASWKNFPPSSGDQKTSNGMRHREMTYTASTRAAATRLGRRCLAKERLTGLGA